VSTSETQSRLSGKSPHDFPGHETCRAGKVVGNTASNHPAHVREPKVSSSLLVIGAAPGSLGQRIAQVAEEESGFVVRTAGISGETYELDFLNRRPFSESLEQFMRSCNVVCTVGVNVESFETSFAVNAGVQMHLCKIWAEMRRNNWFPMVDHWVSIGSNSADIARGGSAAYCASKAGLRQGMRCLARDFARLQLPVSVYGYDPGWINDTPMSDSVSERFSPGSKMHRMIGQDGLEKDFLARMIVNNILTSTGRELNGCWMRIDAGEQ
jgi:NAD(P)-dependent dehydrogenase (short-subunit alcohol dehydrogenase family)